MRFLFDTQLLVWAARESARVPATVRSITEDPRAQLMFSTASIWEVAIKHGLRRTDFDFDPRIFRRGLLDNGYEELPITSDQAVAVATLPMIHADPFDRLLIAQATVEGITLVTADRRIAQYPGPIQHV